MEKVTITAQKAAPQPITTYNICQIDRRLILKTSKSYGNICTSTSSFYCCCCCCCYCYYYHCDYDYLYIYHYQYLHQYYHHGITTVLLNTFIRHIGQKKSSKKNRERHRCFQTFRLCLTVTQG